MNNNNYNVSYLFVLQTIHAAEQHLVLVSKERSIYKHALEQAKKSSATEFTVDGIFEPPVPGSNTAPNSRSMSAHYSFDMAQQVFYPNDPLQPGPMYFLTPRKCAIFGVCCEAIPRQINYLIDEGVDMGKGANSIVSMLHHFFSQHGLGERTVHLHADNCSGQNKNATMVQYLLYRVMIGLHEEITLSFMVVGHTKFSPDWCFGLLKKVYRRTKIGGLSDLADVVNKSAVVNVAQLTGTEDGNVIVPTYDWQSYLSSFFSKLKGIKKLHHLRFHADSPGIVYVKEAADSPEVSISLLLDKDSVPLFDRPPNCLEPVGLSLQRQWYLYNKIREFCPDSFKNKTCPLPNRRIDEEDSPLHSPVTVETTEETTTQRKKPRLCGVCHQSGHNARTCPTK